MQTKQHHTFFLPRKKKKKPSKKCGFSASDVTAGQLAQSWRRDVQDMHHCQTLTAKRTTAPSPGRAVPPAPNSSPGDVFAMLLFPITPPKAALMSQELLFQSKINENALTLPAIAFIKRWLGRGVVHVPMYCIPSGGRKLEQGETA